MTIDTVEFPSIKRRLCDYPEIQEWVDESQERYEALYAVDPECRFVFTYFGEGWDTVRIDYEAGCPYLTVEFNIGDRSCPQGTIHAWINCQEETINFCVDTQPLLMARFDKDYGVAKDEVVDWAKEGF